MNHKLFFFLNHIKKKDIASCEIYRFSAQF